MLPRLFALALIAAILIGLDNERVGAASSTPARDLAQEVLGVFRSKCAGCHGTQVKKPKGRFGYVDDLARLAQNPELVIPGRPEESELWQLVAHDEMPPEVSPREALSQAQKKIIREWIAAGAPAGDRPSQD